MAVADGDLRVTMILTKAELRLPAEKFLDLVEERLAEVREKLFEAKERVDG